MSWEWLAGSLAVSTLRRLYAAGAATPAAVLEAIHRRIAARGADGVWISLTGEAECRRQLAAAEAARRNGASLPLYGIPFAVKDNIDVAGLPTTAACPAFAYQPAESAPAIARLLAAGAICIGKTNLDQFATGLSGMRSPYGVCRSVFDPRFPAGGSSSGSAVAVAAGLVSFAIGTDTGGSGRIPAGFNNIVGLKPTRGLVSTRGVVPACRTLDCVSVFALDCEDAGEVLALMAGYDPADPFSRPAPLEGDLPAPVGERFRFGIPVGAEAGFFGNGAARALFEAAVERLGALGGTAVPVHYTPFAEAGSMLYGGASVAERSVAVGAFIAAHPEAVLPTTADIIARARRLSAADVFAQLYRLAEIRRALAPVWSEIDFLAVPTSGTHYTVAALAAEPVELNNRLGYFSYPVNLLDLSALALPNGFLADGPAMGVTLIAPAFAEQRLLAFGRRWQGALGIAAGAAARAAQHAPDATAGTR
ncbi:MAG TPA: allophanate hydrolase [Stellaceae bacterium]|nr:allophanate hydrolase [Stellaceae bacterium]